MNKFILNTQTPDPHQSAHLLDLDNNPPAPSSCLTHWPPQPPGLPAGSLP